MKIIYKENPLETVVELDEKEQEILLSKIKNNEIPDAIEFAYYYSKKDQPDIEKVKESLREVIEDKSQMENYIKNIFNEYIEALQSSHCGDCTCFPATCVKCVAEDLLGICTTKGLNKHSAHQIFYEFKKTNSIDKVIESLSNYNPEINNVWKDNIEGWNEHLPRWKKEALEAAKWLMNYKEEFLIGQ